MEEKQYQIWWQLHRRVAVGETLTEEERRVYESGLAEMEAGEWNELRSVGIDFQSLRQQWQRLTEQNQQLARQEATLRELAMRLEQQYRSLTGETLGLGV